VKKVQGIEKSMSNRGGVTLVHENIRLGRGLKLRIESCGPLRERRRGRELRYFIKELASNGQERL